LPINPDHKYSHLFDTAGINQEIRHKSVKAGAANLISQGLTLSVTLVRAAILARLLTPEDYGLFTLVAVVASFAIIFKDLGLSTATIREKEITHAQVSNLFWINTLIGIGSMAVVIAIAPVIVWFYQDARLLPIALLLSVAFVFGGLSVQHQALLARQMQFGKIALVTVFSSIASSITGVLIAWFQYNYWALIWMEVSRNLFLMIGFWYLTGWRPGLPSRFTGTKKIIKIGLDVAGMNAFSTLTKGIDKIIAGRISSAYLLGLYSKGNQVPEMISMQFRMALFSVALPALASLQDEQNRFAQYYYKFLYVVSWVTMPLSVFCFIFSEAIIQIYFGSQWAGSVIYLRIFSLNAFLLPVITTLDQVPLALGHSRRYLAAGISRSVGTIFCVAVGAFFYGIVGIAIGLAIANIITFIPFITICTKNAPITVKEYFQTISIPLLISIVLGIVFYFLKSNYLDVGIIYELSFMLAYLVTLSMVVLICDFYRFGVHLGIVSTLINKINSKGQK